MRIKEIHEILQKSKNGKVTQNDIASAIGTTRANVSKLFAKNSFLNDDKIGKIEKYFGITLRLKQKVVHLEYYPEKIATETDGKIVMSEKHVRTIMPLGLFPSKEDAEYIMCHSDDNSMMPFIMKGDFVIIEINSEKIENNKIHAFMYKGEFYIRRLSKNINQIIVEAENKGFPTQYIEKNEMKDLHIFGKVVYIGRADGLN